MRYKGSNRAFTGLVFAMALIAAGATSTTAGASSGPVRGVTADSIKVGGMGYALGFGAQAAGAEARFAQANKQGGVYGRKIDFVGYQDDGGSSTQDVEIAHQLVEQDQVFAVVPVTSTVFNAASYFAQNQVPFFGWAITPNWCGNNWAFGYDGCAQPSPGTWTGDPEGALFREVYGGPVTGKTFAVIGEDSPAGKQGAITAADEAKAAGFKVVYAQAPVPGPPATVGDWSSYANQLMKSNGGKAPDAISIGIFPTEIAALSKALRDLGYKGRIFNAVMYNPLLGQAAAGLNLDTMVAHAPFETTPASAGMVQFKADMKAYSPNTPLSTSALQGWLSADLFLSILQKVGKNLTPQTFEKVANSNFSWVVPGVSGRAVFPLDHKLQVPCSADVETQNGSTWTVAAKFVCGTIALAKK